MTQTIVSVVLFLVILALLPLAIRWYQQRASGPSSAAQATRVVSAVAVGPQQRVVTIEVGPEGGRTWLVLGVTAQSISCLHSMPAEPARAGAPTTMAAQVPGRSGDPA